MKNNTTFRRFIHWMDELKHNRTALKIIIGLNIFMAIGSNIADWHWLSSVPLYGVFYGIPVPLIIFAPICSLYTPLLAVWFLLYYYKKKIPAWFTTFLFIAIVSYGIMAYIYYPLYMYAYEMIHWRLIGNMIWVSAYALQAFILHSELKPLKTYQYLLIIGYFFFKDYADRYLGTFIDILDPRFPEWLKDFFGVIMVTLHILIIGGTIILVSRRKLSRTAPQAQASFSPEHTFPYKH